MSKQSFTHTAFEQFLSEHKLMGSHCKSCDTFFLPARPMCTKCFSEDMEWVEQPQNGRLRAFTIVYIAPTAMLEAGYGRKNPYISGIVELENGLSISAQILGLDPAKPEEIKIGTALKVEYITRGEDEAKKTFLAFRAV